MSTLYHNVIIITRIIRIELLLRNIATLLKTSRSHHATSPWSFQISMEAWMLLIMLSCWITAMLNPVCPCTNLPAALQYGPSTPGQISQKMPLSIAIIELSFRSPCGGALGRVGVEHTSTVTLLFLQLHGHGPRGLVRPYPRPR